MARKSALRGFYENKEDLIFQARLDREFENTLPMNSSAKLNWSELEDDGGGYYDYKKNWIFIGT